jgi:signal transduction histidine kinase
VKQGGGPSGLSPSLVPHLLTCLRYSPDIILLLGADGRCLHLNEAAYEHFGRDVSLQTSLKELFPDQETRTLLCEGIDEALSLGNWSGEASISYEKGLELPVSVAITASTAEPGDPVFLVQLRDLSGRYQAESALAGALLRSQDEERRRIGRELHDSTGQTLAALEIGLSRLERTMEAEKSPHAEAVLECNRLATRCTLDIRTVSALLHPPLLDDLGLCNTLRWYASRFSQRSGIKTSLEAPDDDTRWPAPLELALFRIVQESLTNIHRYSLSATAVIRLKEEGRAIELEVEDYGCGIPETVLHRLDSPGVGVGLSGMRQRVRELRGRFHVESRPGFTRIAVRLPLEPFAE